MYLKVTYDEDFDTLLIHLKSKYGNELFDMDGIGKQTDMNLFSRDFFDRSKYNTADVSVDANANVDSRDIIAYNFELPKPFFRLNSYYLLWKKLRDIYGLSDANKIVEMQFTGDIYINDFNDISKPYCFNYSTIDIMMNGLPMVKKIHSIAPKYLFSFKSQLEQFVVIASNSTLGATGLADIFIVMSYYIDRILNNGHDAGIYFDGWLSDKEKTQITKLINNIPVRKADGSNDEEIEKHTLNINKILKKTGPANKEWFERNVWKYLKETLVSFIYTINQPMRGKFAS